MAAIDQGSDGLECDLRLTKDLVPILWHDPTLKRNAGVSGDVAALTLLEIQKRYSQVITFEEFLNIAITNRQDIAIETKHPVPTGRAIETLILKALQEKRNEIKKAKINIFMMSFSWLAIESIHKEIDTVFLFERFYSQPGRSITSAQSLGPSIEIVTSKPEIMTQAKTDGKKLFIWTVDLPKDIEFCAQSQVDVIITNKPAQARKVLGYP